MLRLLSVHQKVNIFQGPSVAILQRISSPCEEAIAFGPFNLNTQRRWKKPVISAQMRLENRTRDLQLDNLMRQQNKLKSVLKLHEIMSKSRGPFVSVQVMSRWTNIVGLNVPMGYFLHKYPHIFHVSSHSIRRNICCKLTEKIVDLIEMEAKVVKEYKLVAIERLRKLLMMSTKGTLHIHALRLIKMELGLPENFVDSILLKYPEYFKLIDLEVVALVSRDESLAVAEVEKWREKEFREKWLAEFETKYAFQVQFPTGFRIEKGFKEKHKYWQRMAYLKPYDSQDVVVRERSRGGIERFEKRAVGIIHELLSLTTEKIVDVERLSHFRKDFSMEINIRELLLKHQGIFYISTKGVRQTVFLREAYSDGCLKEPNPIYTVRRQMLELLLLGSRHTRSLKQEKEFDTRSTSRTSNYVDDGEKKFDGSTSRTSNYVNDSSREGDWVIPILESSAD